MARRADLVGLLTAEAISITGSRMSLIAVPWLVLSTTGSPAMTGVVAAAETILYVVAAALGASLVDRIGARRASIAADGFSVVVFATVPFAYHLGVGVLAALMVLAGTLRGVGDLAKRVLLPAAVQRCGMDLARATAIYDGISRLSALVGGPGAGALIAWLGAPAVITVD